MFNKFYPKSEEVAAISGRRSDGKSIAQEFTEMAVVCKPFQRLLSALFIFYNFRRVLAVQ